MWVCLKMLCTPLYPLVLLIRQSRFEKWLAIIGNINPTFSVTNPCGKVTQNPNWSPKVTHCTSAESAFPDRNCQAAWEQCELNKCAGQKITIGEPHGIVVWISCMNIAGRLHEYCMNILILHVNLACVTVLLTLLLDHWWSNSIRTRQYKDVTDSTATLDVWPTADGCWWPRGRTDDLC